MYVFPLEDLFSQHIENYQGKTLAKCTYWYIYIPHQLLYEGPAVGAHFIFQDKHKVLLIVMFFLLGRQRNWKR